MQLRMLLLYDDRLEVTSPGKLLNNVTIKKMIEGYSKARNPAIARAFSYMKIIEKWGGLEYRVYLKRVKNIDYHNRS